MTFRYVIYAFSSTFSKCSKFLTDLASKDPSIPTSQVWALRQYLKVLETLKASFLVDMFRLLVS
jgi:hypothetical protein